MGEAWFAAERSGWRDDYARELRRNLDKEIYPEFGDDRVSAMGPAEVIAYDRKLRARKAGTRKLSESAAANIMKPLRGLLDIGKSRRSIAGGRGHEGDREQGGPVQHGSQYGALAIGVGLAAPSGSELRGTGF